MAAVIKAIRVAMVATLATPATLPDTVNICAIHIMHYGPWSKQMNLEFEQKLHSPSERRLHSGKKCVCGV